jgi:tetratricopeptide (TPR) repeat protein
MARHKRSSHGKSHRQPQQAAPAPDQREAGLRAFRAGRFDAAIVEWAGFARSDARVAAALAEAYFRRALTRPGGVAQLSDLRQALKLAPGEPRYQYHLGLALHRTDDLDGAIQQYRAVLQGNPAWPGAGMVLALAILEQDPRADLAALPGHAPAVQAALAPVQALLRGQMPALAGAAVTQGAPEAASPAAAPWESSGPISRLWYGLGLIQAGDSAARVVLDDSRPLPTAAGVKIRRYYWGVAAARSGDVGAALKAWQHVADRGLARPWLSANLAAALLHMLPEEDSAAEAEGAAALVERATRLPATSPAMSEALVRRLDKSAHAAAAGDWAQAAELWEKARDMVAAASGLGSPRPLLHNLALSYEAQERWMEAAEAWRAMLRTQPRKTSRGSAARGGGDSATSQPAALTEAQWAWVRKRVIDCYKRAGMPGEAVAIFRQAIKADPQDVDTRLQLVDALLANEQDVAAYNELQRILEIDAHHVEAQLRLAVLQDERGEWYNTLNTLRRLQAQEPERQDVRRLLVEHLLRIAQNWQESGYFEQVSTLLKEGESLAPDDFRFPLQRARVAIEEHQWTAARELLGRTLDLAADRPEAYVDVIDCWAVANDMGEARAALARAEATLSLEPRFYIDLGTRLLTKSAPLRAQLQARSRKAAPKRATEEDWANLATEVLDRAVALAPDSAEVREQIAAALAVRQPELALPYAEAAGRLAPDNPETLILLGVTLALNGRVPEAQQTLRQAARLARKQGKPTVAQRAEALVRQVASPLLRLTLSMAQLYEEEGVDPADLFG